MAGMAGIQSSPARRRSSLPFVRGFLALICLSVLARSAMAAPLDLGIMAFLPGDDVPGPAAGDQIAPEIARGNGSEFLVAWQDDRGNSPDIYAARVDGNGNPIDTIPIAISQAAGAQGRPRVAWNGTNWLVTWQSQIPTQFFYAAGVLAVRVSPQGQVLDASPITVIAYQNSSDLIYGLACDGTNWAVVSEGTSAGEAAIRGIRVAPDGTVLDPGGVVIVPETYYLRFGIELGGVPGEYLLVWNEWRSGTNDDVLAYRLTSSLQKIEATPFVITARTLYETHAKVASNGTGFFVAWDLNDNYLSSDVYGTRVSVAGQVLDPGGKAFSNAGPGYGRDPSVTWDGANWIASWPNYGSGGLNAGRMSPQGTILDPNGVSMPALGWGAIAGFAGGGFVATWSDALGGSQDAYAAPVTGSLVPGGRTCVSLGAPRQTYASFASNGNGYLAVFLSARSNGSRILGQRIDADGNAIDAEPFEIVGPPAGYTSPSVAWNGSLYMLSYVDQSKVYARRIAADGTILDPTPIFVMNGLESGVAAMGDQFLVVTNYAPQNPQIVLVFGTRIRGSDGAKLDLSPISIGGSFSLHPRVSRLGNRWLVAWEQHPTHDDPHAGVVGNFVDGGGGAGSSFTVSAGGGAYNLNPAIAANPDTALVAWSESRAGFNNLDIYGRRVLANGGLLDGAELALSTAPNSQTLPALGWDGGEFVALFQDPRNIPVFFDEHLDIYGTRLTSGGQVLDPDGFPVANDPVVSEILPAVAGGGGSAILGCSVYRTAAPYAAFRIGARRLRNLVPGDVADGGVVLAGRPRVAAAPNPSSAVFHLRITSQARQAMSLSIFDVTGREVVVLFHGVMERGEARLTWDGEDASGRRAPPGIYFACLRHAAGTERTKLTLR